MEEQLRKYSRGHLENLAYRVLQKLAKSLNLPSNVKKVYLIDLINAKKFKSQRELETLIDHVKRERKLLSQKKAKSRRSHIQGSEITSTNCSPPITNTPKRTNTIVFKYSPELQQAMMKHPSKQSILQNSLITQSLAKRTAGSDRVLRSFRDRPNYRILNMNNTVLGVIKAQNPDTKINIVSRDGKYPKFNVTAVVKKHIASRAVTCSEGQMVVSKKERTPLPKRYRKISGIYPLTTAEKCRAIFSPTVNFTRRDGSLSKIKALVQKPLPQINFNGDTTQHDITIQDLINNKIDKQDMSNAICTLTNSNRQNNIQPSNMPDLHQQNCNENNSYQIDPPPDEIQHANSMDSPYSVYYHKKIRADQVKTQKVTTQMPKSVASVQGLPKINDVFSKFNDVYRRNLSQPIYVQVQEGSERTENYPTYEPRLTVTNTSLLETMYNFKSQFLTNPPLLRIVTTANTTCVFSTPVITSAVPHPPATFGPGEYNNASCQRDKQYQNPDFEMVPRIQDYLRLPEQEESSRRDFMCNEVLRSSTSSLETLSSQELGASVTIPEMVEDALELISQDGDYMERIGMDVRMQCILCSWAGPKFILEYHIRKEHASEIHVRDNSEWHMTYTLGGLVARGAWACRVLRGGGGGGGGGGAGGGGGGTLLTLSARYDDPDCFMAALNIFSTDDESPKFGKITIYNKVTGEPYTWEGELQELPHTMPYQNDSNCLRIELSKLDLLPNSANLKLLNRELVIKTPAKVIVGQPELNDIHIILFIKVS